MARKSKRMASNSRQMLKNHRFTGKRKPGVADNIYGSAILGTGATSQMLPFYSNVQKRARFALCNERVNVYTLH